MKIKKKLFLGLLVTLLCLLSGCSTIEVQQGEHYNLSNKQHLYALSTWSFQGRIAVKNGPDSWSAYLAWTHQPGLDRLKLSGLLGQGTVLIELTPDQIKIDQGDGRANFSENVDQLITDKLGVLVPISALTYWVLGLVQPGLDYENHEASFQQLAWTVNYPLYMLVGSELMPHKMQAIKDQLKLTLVFDQWQL